ncbi:hypothetical protein [Arthrobacter psychrochitiniphilus]|nr:hypothetical protein [Arthrobacter psychrochitiniphilus]NYG16408.1 hypothetical protein [Arthrobacter psychrochitiniphilus]
MRSFSSRVPGTFPALLMALLLALGSMTLVVIGCTGAQASPGMQTIAVSPAAEQQITAATTAALNTRGILNTLNQLSPECKPGHKKVRLESHAVSPNLVQLQSPRGSFGSPLPHRLLVDGAAQQFLGRIPAALSHLDLGIVRT